MRARDEHDIDDDLRREDIDARRAEARANRCQCGSDLPGRCPGPMFCPYSDFNADDEDEVTKLFGLDASEMGEIAREAFNDCNDIDGPHWPTVGAIILAALQEYRKCH